MARKKVDKEVIEIINGKLYYIDINKERKEVDSNFVFDKLDIRRQGEINNLNKITIDIYDSYITVTTTSNGLNHTKEIEPDKLLDLLAMSKSDRTVINSGRFPKNDANIVEVFYEEPGNYRKIILLSPSGHGVMRSVNNIYNIEYPSMLFILKLQGNRIIDTKIACVREKSGDKITDNSRIYHYPFNHVNQFSVCWGTNQLPDIENLNQAIIIPKIFFDSYHVAGHGAGQNTLGLTPEALYKKLESKEIAVDSVLVDAGLNYKDFLKKYI